LSLLVTNGALEITLSQAPTPLIKVGHVPTAKYSELTTSGNVSQIVPSFHGLYTIPIKDNAANHTLGFTEAAATKEAHELTILTSKGMAGVGLRVLMDDGFAAEVKGGFQAIDKKLVS
jgi:hypothetical protein